MEITELELTAVRKRQDLDRLETLYDLFESYIEQFAAILQHSAPKTEARQRLLATQESVRLELREQEYRFLEWHEGDQVPNPAIFSLVERPDIYLRNPSTFNTDRLLARSKFEHLIYEKRRVLEETQEELTVLTSETQARAVPTSARPSEAEPTTTKIKRADEVAEIGFKWVARLIQFFAPWAEKIFHLLRP